MSQDGLTFDMAKKACDVLGEATADDIVTLESDNIPVTIENLSKLIAAGARIVQHRKPQQIKLWIIRLQTAGKQGL